MRNAPHVTHHVATTIQRPVDAVAGYLFDPRTMPQWSAILYEVEEPEDRSVFTRHRLRANLRILGVCVTVEGRLVDLDLDERRGAIEVHFPDGDGVIAHELRVEDAGDASVVTFRNAVTLPSWLAESVPLAVTRRYVELTAAFALETIKTILEADAEGSIAEAVRRGPAVTEELGKSP
jgi:uncharacterized membrane protein